MAYELKHRRGTAADTATFTGAEGEITYKTDTKQLVVHDGVTPGGTTLNDAANVGYTPAGTDAVATTVQSELRELDALAPHIRTQKPAAYSFPRLMKTLQEYRHDLQSAINIVGFGSSVGVGASLPDAATQAPVAYFVSKLKSTLDPANIYNFAKFNDSVNGSALIQSLTALSGAVTAGHTPKLCVLAYGMNDAGVALYNAGQTYPAVYSNIIRFVTEARKLGADVVLMTTPHHKCTGFFYVMPDGVAQVYPTSIAAPVSPSQLQPPASQSNITADFLGTGQTITASHRHLRVNQAMRQAATDAGVPLIDVERYWFNAVAKYGEAALFNAGETVHPNLLGHQQSYWLAIDEFLESMAWQTGQEGQEPRLNGLFGVNTANPSAVLDIAPPYPDGTSNPLQVSARVGAVGGNSVRANAIVWKIEASTGDLVGNYVDPSTSAASEAYRITAGQTKAISSGTSFVSSPISLFNRSGTVTVAALPDNSAGTAWITAFQSGIGRKRVRIEWVTNSGVTTLGTAEAIGAGVFTGPTASGLNLQVTLAAANSNVNCKLDYVT